MNPKEKSLDVDSNVNEVPFHYYNNMYLYLLWIEYNAYFVLIST